MQHIHRDAQFTAIRELYRVLKPGSRLCIMASQETGRWHTLALKAGRFLAAAMRRQGNSYTGDNGRSSPDPAVVPPFQLYGHCWPYQWWRDQMRRLDARAEVHCLRLFGKPEFPPLRIGPAGVRRLRGFEMLFSRRLARASSLIVTDVPKGNVRGFREQNS